MSGMHRDRVDPVKQGRLRLAIQVITAVFLNGYAAGFAGGKIYAGDLKKVCVPVLNCYSCPGAVGSCPIGAMQTMLGSHGRFPFYVLGLLMLFGILLGRAVCGFLCPFGLVQDLLAKIPVKKLRVPGKIDRLARYLKYVVLALLIMIPVLSRYGEPVFCKYLCPAGTLEAGIPLMIAVEDHTADHYSRIGSLCSAVLLPVSLSAGSFLLLLSEVQFLSDGDPEGAMRGVSPV